MSVALYSDDEDCEKNGGHERLELPDPIPHTQLLIHENPAMVNLIGLYEQYRCLWDKQDDDYVNRPAREEAWASIYEYYQQVVYQPDEKKMKKTFDNMRHSWRREIRLIKSNSTTGSGKKYKPKLWYFYLLQFLQSNTNSTDQQSDDADHEGYKLPTRRSAAQYLAPQSEDMSRDLKHFFKFGKKILGAGVNYKSLITERKVAIPKEPILFLKPTTTYISDGENIQIPRGYKVDHEVELGVIIGEKCKNVTVEEADKYIAGYCLALDLTATNILKEARAKGLPWCTGKGFDTATPVSPAIDKRLLPCPDDVRLWCSVNGKTRQDSTTSDMVFSIKELVSFASQNMTLEPNDLILTGSPAGVGPIAPGDTIEAGLGKDLITICFKVCP